MPLEIERKFLVNPGKLPSGFTGTEIIQGYIPLKSDDVIRIRIAGSSAFITLKGKDDQGIRPEFEYEIPESDAHEIISIMCMKPYIRKIRTVIWFQGQKWEIDRFLDENEGLWIAEAELQSAGDVVAIPPWVTGEVTGDNRYLNSSLVQNPYMNWSRE